MSTINLEFFYFDDDEKSLLKEQATRAIIRKIDDNGTSRLFV